MRRINLEPSYRGVWTSPTSFGFFSMWVKPNGTGAILEYGSSGLIRANVTEFARTLATESGQSRISFVKQYEKNSEGLFVGRILYLGDSKVQDIFTGHWRADSSDSGDFSLVSARSKKAVRFLREEIGRAWLGGLDKKVREFQAECPYLPTVPEDALRE